MRMDARTKAKYEARARIIKALAHPTRLYIVDMLTDEEMCVCDMTEKIGADISTVSKHLSVLKSAGIVSDDKRGTQVYYSLCIPCVLNFFGCVEAILKDSAMKQMELHG